MAAFARVSHLFGSVLTAAAVVLAGCGSVPGAAVSLRPAGVTVQRADLDLRGDGGRFDVVFQGLRSGYQLLATRADINSVRIVLNSSRLVEPMVKVVGPQELNQVMVTVPFSNVPAGDVQVKVQALDQSARVIGAKESTAAVAVGQTTVLQMAVKLDAVTGSGNLGAAITFEDATPAPTPSSSVSPTPTPTPSPASPVQVESYRLVRHLFGYPEVEITLYNTSEAQAKARVYTYFYNDNSLKDSQASEVTLDVGQRTTFKVKASALFVNKVNVAVR